MHTDASVGDTGGRSGASARDEGDLQDFKEMMFSRDKRRLTSDGFIRCSTDVMRESKPSVLPGILAVRPFESEAERRLTHHRGTNHS